MERKTKWELVACLIAALTIAFLGGYGYLYVKTHRISIVPEGQQTQQIDRCNTDGKGLDRKVEDCPEEIESRREDREEKKRLAQQQNELQAKYDLLIQEKERLEQETGQQAKEDQLRNELEVTKAKYDQLREDCNPCNPCRIKPATRPKARRETRVVTPPTIYVQPPVPKDPEPTRYPVLVVPCPE